MRRSQLLPQILFALVLTMAAACSLSPALAVFPDMQGFEGDTDWWEPNPAVDYVPLEDPNLDDVWFETTLPPAGFRELRPAGNWSGIIEEVPSGWSDVPASRGDSFAVMYPDSFNGVYSKPAAQFEAIGSPWSFQMDVYTDSRIAPNFAPGTGYQNQGGNGNPDFWWTNALSDPTGPGGDFGGYQTESGMTAQVLDDGVNPRVWQFTTTTPERPVYKAAVDTWYTLEMEYHDNNVDGNMAVTHRVWNKDHSQLLYSETLRDLFMGPFTVERAGGPRYSWLTFFEQNMPRLLIDNSGVDAPIVLQQAAPVASGSNVNVSVAGGASSIGGLEATFDQVLTSGTFESVYTQSISEADLASAVGENAVDSINFALSSQPAQAWTLDFDGEFESTTIVVNYDESSIFGDESEIRIMHFANGVWEMPADQVINTLDNTITFSTTSFSPFVLASVPEPSSLALALVAVVGVAAGARRRRRRV